MKVSAPPPPANTHDVMYYLQQICCNEKKQDKQQYPNCYEICLLESLEVVVSKLNKV